MASAVRLRTDFTAGELRQLAKKAKHVNQAGDCCRWQQLSTA